MTRAGDQTRWVVSTRVPGVGRETDSVFRLHQNVGSGSAPRPHFRPIRVGGLREDRDGRSQVGEQMGLAVQRHGRREWDVRPCSCALVVPILVKAHNWAAGQRKDTLGRLPGRGPSAEGTEIMALHTWWKAERTQRYWMEITHRPDGDIGTNLWCPASGSTWSNQLASQVRSGDRVLHWKAWEPQHEAALIGWSQATGGPSLCVSDYYEDEPDIETWMVPLGGLKRFKRPIPSSTLLPLLDELMDVRDQLEESCGKPVYFPFIRYGRGQLRARQGYLTKFPVELFDVIPGISGARK